MLTSCIIFTLTITGCANTSAGNLFSHYTAQMKALYEEVMYGDYEDAVNELPEDNVAGDILDNMEKGRVYLLNQEGEQSQKHFKLTDSAVKTYQDKAIVSLSETTTSLSALATNDNLTYYSPPDYELGFLHLYLGLNYLKSNDLEGALVEMRRANQVQEKAKKIREKDLQDAEEERQAQGVKPNLGNVISRYPNAGKKLQAVQNAYLLFLSGLLYETNDSLNDAWIDYNRALALVPNNREVIQATLRVGDKLGMRDALAKLTKRYGQRDELAKNQTRLIFIDEQGIVQAMQELKFSIPLYTPSGVALYSVALPFYEEQGHNRYASLTVNGESLSKPNHLTDVNLMAKNNLSEKILSVATRQILRVWAKDRIRETASAGNDFVNLGLNIWNTLTEHADTRSWITLPSQVYTSSLIVESGKQTINVGSETYSFDTKAGNTVLIWSSRQGDGAVVWHKQLGAIE
ncbi:hypothetical protein N9R79_00745 [Vibrio sp.]|nr:hypothetical protein [Vibrio sp.]